MSVFRNAAILVLVATATPAAAADWHADLAFEVGENNGDKSSEWVIGQLVTFKLGAKCSAKVLANKDMIGSIAGGARTIQKYAKEVSGDALDWSSIETRNRTSDEQTTTNRAVVEKMINEFKPKFRLTVHNEGDDCTASMSGLWWKYTNSVLQALVKFPPKSGKAFVTVNAISAAKTVTVEVADDGSTITITGPRDVEAPGWGDGRVEKALKRVSSKG